MKILLIYMMAIGLFITGCKSKKGITLKGDNGTSVTIDPSNAEEKADEMTKKMEELKKLTPYTVAEVKAYLPEELMGMKRSNFSANSAMGFATGEAQYKNEDGSNNIRLTIFDCAGEAGSGIFAMSYWTKMSMESENDEGYTKTIDFMGGKAVEDYKKYNSAYSLTYEANDRLLVTLQGENISLDVLKDAAKKLDLKPS